MSPRASRGALRGDAAAPRCRRAPLWARGVTHWLRFGRSSLAISWTVALASACQPSPEPRLPADSEVELCDGPVEFPDPVLREVVLGLIERSMPTKRPTDGSAPMLRTEIVAAELRTITGVSAPEIGIVDLTGLECAQGLVTLGLAGNEIADLTPLLSLTGLRELEVSRNPLAGLETLGRLRTLEKLSIEETGSKDLTALEGLTRLESLAAGKNGVVDLGPVAGLQRLTSLTVEGNAIEDVTPLRGLTRLFSLDLAKNRVADVSPLSSLLELEYLDVSRNQVNSLEPLRPLLRLSSLDVSRNQIVDLQGVDQMFALVQLFASDNQLESTRGLGGLGRLTRVDLARNRIVSIAELSGLRRLQRLVLAGNRVETLLPLTGLPELRELDLRANAQVIDLAPLATLPSLAWWAGGGGGLALELSPLLGLSRLRSVVYVDAGLTDLAVLGSLPALAFLDLSGTRLEARSLEQIGKAGRLQSLNLNRTGITGLAGLEALQQLEVVSLAENDLSGFQELAALPGLLGIYAAKNPLVSLAGLEQHEFLSDVDVSDTRLDSLAPLVANERFRRGDTVKLTGTRLDADDCPDIATLRARMAEVATDVMCE